MRARMSIIAITFLTLALVVSVLGACAPASPQVVEKDVVRTVIVEKEVAVEKKVVETVVVEKVITATPEPSVLRFGGFGPVINIDAMKATSGTDKPPEHWVYGRLVWWDSTMTDVVPQVAESWTISEDGKTYVFKIREGVKFHNGREVTAEDVVFSWDRIFEIGQAGQGWAQLVEVDSYEATGEYEFTVKLKNASAVFLTNLPHWALVIIPEEEVDTLGTHPISCGPYKFVEWEPGDHLTFVKFEDFWDKEMLTRLPDKIILLPITDEQTRISLLKTGDIDIAMQISARSMEEIDNTPGLHTIVAPFSTASENIVFNMTREPTNDKKLRQALAYAVDKEAILQTAYFGNGEVGCSAIPKGHWAYSEMDCPEYDPEKARQLLKEAGYEEGLVLLDRPYIYEGEDRVAQALQQSFKEAGVDLEIEMMEGSLWVDKVFYGDHDFTVSQAGYSSIPDPALIYRPIYGKGGADNFGLYENPRVEELLELGAKTLDREKRKEIYKELQEILLEDVPQIYICSIVPVAAANDKVQLEMAPTGYVTPLFYRMTFNP